MTAKETKLELVKLNNRIREIKDEIANNEELQTQKIKPFNGNHRRCLRDELRDCKFKMELLQVEIREKSMGCNVNHFFRQIVKNGVPPELYNAWSLKAERLKKEYDEG